MVSSKEIVEEKKMCDAYLEYRTAQFNLMAEEAEKLGFIDFLKTPRTIDEITNHFKLVRGQKGLLGILNSFIKFGIIKTVEDGNIERFIVKSSYSLPNINTDLLRIAVGEHGIKDLKQINAFSQIFDYMLGKREEVCFDKKSENLWEEFLEYPYYKFGRQKAVEFISYPGASVLDFGAGLGHGTESISKIVGIEGRAVAIESSLDFVNAAKERLSKFVQAEVKHMDMSNTLTSEFEESSFDGAMFIGAFHYVKDKQRCLRELASILRPGGKLVIGNWFTKNGALDEGMLEFGTAMINPPAYGISPQKFYKYLEEVKFAIKQHYFFGCQGWFFMELESV